MNSNTRVQSRPRAQTDNSYRTTRRKQLVLSAQAYDDIAAYQSQVYGNQQLVLAKKNNIIKLDKHIPKHKSKPKHRKCIKLNLVLKRLKDRMIEMDELSSVMISKHKMRLTVFESDKFIEKRGVFEFLRGATFEFRFDIYELSKLPRIYCLKSPMLHHPNIDPKTGLIALSYNVKYYVKPKKKYVDKIWSLIVSLITVLESPSLYRDKDILNKKSAEQFRKGSHEAISYTNNIINEEKEINNKDVWTEYIDLDEENTKLKRRKQKKVTFNDKKNNGNKNISFGLSVPEINNNISSIDFDSNQMQQLVSSIGATKGFKLRSC